MSYNAPFVRMFYKDKELSQLVKEFSYKESEEGDDHCRIVVCSDNRKIADEPQFQDDAELKIVWGYVGSSLTKTQVVYIQETEWEYGKENVIGTIIATEKGISLKQSTAGGMYRNTSLLGLAKSIGDKHGLNTYLQLPNDETSSTAPKSKSKPLIRLLELGEDIEVSDELINANLPPIKVLVPSEVSEMIKKQAEQQREVNDISKKLYGVTYNEILEQGTTRSGRESVQNRILLEKAVQSMKTYPLVAQGNKSDKQVLNDYAMKEPGGPFIAETRGKDLIIRKRNFTQKPYRTYEYGGGEGNFLYFRSAPKRRSRKGTSVNMAFGAWDPLKKQYQEGNANAINDYSKALTGKYLELYDNYKELAKTNPGLIVGWQNKGKEFGAPVGAYTGAGDNTNVVINYRIPITVTDKIKILEGQLASKGINVNPNKKVVDPNNDSIQDAYSQASNLRNNSDLKKEPCTARIVGDPNLRVGIIITLIGIGKKYSGNYYIAEASHSITKGEGWIVDLNLYRHGSNVKANDNYISYQEAGKTLNDQKGPESIGMPPTKQVQVTQNIR